MKKVPEIAKEEEYMLPKTPKEGVFYIDNFGFKLKVTSPFKIFYLPEEDVHELCYFEIKKGKCLTHEYYASDTWMLKKQMGEKEYSKYVTPELEQYIEEMGYLIPDYYRDYSISPQNGKLIFEQKGNELKLGNFIKCEYKKEKYPDWVPQNGWESDPNTIGYIHIYTDTHEFEDDFYFEILDFDINKTKAKVKMTVGTSYLYVGLVPIEYINPLTYFSDFFEKVKSSKKAITLEQNRSKNIFYEYGMQHSPEWKALIELDQLDNEETRHEMIFKIARSFGVEAQCKKHNIQYVRKDSSTYDEGDYYEWKFKSL